MQATGKRTERAVVRADYGCCAIAAAGLPHWAHRRLDVDDRDE
jgi:hypothetical protein